MPHRCVKSRGLNGTFAAIVRANGNFLWFRSGLTLGINVDFTQDFIRSRYSFRPDGSNRQVSIISNRLRQEISKDF